MKLMCVETGYKTEIKLTQDEPWENDDILDAAANNLLKREPEHKYDFVCIDSRRMRSEICHALTDLTEHTGEYRSFKIISDNYEAAAALGCKGGSAKSEAKTKANRENAKKGGWPKGRPRKTPTDK